MYHIVTHEDLTRPSERHVEVANSEETRGEARKERVLHTRIPAVLEQELKAAAFALRMPVSNLVRTILEDAVAMADRATGHVESSLQRAAEQMHSEREKLRSRVRRLSPLSQVLAYQPVKIAAPTRCAGCNAELERGAAAALGVTERPGPKIFVCTHCVEERAPPTP